MNILIWGLGYVGSVSAACLAELGHNVLGIDTDPAKVMAINEGDAPIYEPGLDELVRRNVLAGKLEARSQEAGSVAHADLSLICVGTPSASDGSVDTSALAHVARTIGSGLRETNRYHVVVVRSTVWPGTTSGLIRTLLEEESGKRAGQDFGLVMNPELLREGTAIRDFYEPPYHIIGALDARSGDIVQALYDRIDAPCHQVRIEEAEIMKVVNNAFHALKIGFANEVGRICAAQNLDPYVVMNLVCADSKLNISRHYLRPGPAFGGSCLPKDLRSILHEASRLNIELPILSGILPSNQLVIETMRQRVRALHPQRVCVLGLSFKAGTDDLRESPALELIRGLKADGIEVRAFDPDVVLCRLTGGNLAYLRQSLPDCHDVLCPTLQEALTDADAIVICKELPEFNALFASALYGNKTPILKAV
jgi:GDP-mannose 6-dehydrogenase